MKKISDPLSLPAPTRTTTGGTARLSATVVMVTKELQRDVGLLRDRSETPGSISEEQVRVLLEQVETRLGLELTPIERTHVLAHIEKEARPFGILQELVEDPSISDIIITDYSKVCVQQGRRNIKTDLSFVSPESYEAFVERLLTKAGASYSTKRPIADGMIGSFARIHAVHTSLCDSGPYLTIRLNRFASVRLADLVAAGLAPEPLLMYLRGLVIFGKTLLLAGEVGTGKTTLARAIASEIPTDESIVVIEDTPEIRLEHPHVRYLATRDSNAEGAGRISPSECIRAGMRMAMNRIIFGEIRDAEAAESFIDVCASGHPGLSTVHARSAQEAIVRLELFLGRAQKGVEKKVLTEQISTAVQAIVHLDICRASGKRRIMEVIELGAVADGVLRQREMFRYEASPKTPRWKVVNKSSTHKDALESLSAPVQLHTLGAYIEPSWDTLYREAARGAW